MVTLPVEFATRMKRMLGEEYPAFAACFDGTRALGLRRNLLKTEEEEFLRNAPCPLEPVPWAPEGYYYLEGERPGLHPLHEAGAYYIQEPSAMAAVPFLDPQPGERILDLCAAPGGKSTQIAARMAGRGLLVSNEVHPARARILSQNVERMGIRNALVTNEEPGRLAARFPLFFDRILVDAPCSGEGMFRKEEAALAGWSPENVAHCAKRQREILEEAARMLRPGGRLVYSTCTFSPEENEGTIGSFLARHEEFSLEDPPLFPGMSHGNPLWGEGKTEGLEKTVRIWPHRARGEGHFIAVLRRGEEEGAVSPGEQAESRMRSQAESRMGSQAESRMENQMESRMRSQAENRMENQTESRIENQAGKRMGNQAGKRAGKSAAPRDGRLDRQQQKLAAAFFADTLAGPEQWMDESRLLSFGENLYLAPEGTPPLAGLRVLRPGLQLGSFRRDRFEPAHALAMALRPKEALRVRFLSGNSREAARYLGGEALADGPFLSAGPGRDGQARAAGEKGWVLMTVDGCALGWARLSGGILKNHYPRGLRRFSIDLSNKT